jgi:DNA-binding LacI/PurR family transcriptional regulator
VLEHHGYDVLCVSPDQLGDGLSPNDLAILAPFEERAATELAAELIRQGHRRIVLVSHPRDGVVLRQRDRETGVCVIPRLFTAFDIRWVEEQLRA